MTNESSPRRPGEGAIAGLLLAAGAGRRMGRPKALVQGDDGVAWVVRGTRLLRAAGCSPVVVVIGAQADEVEALLMEEVALADVLIVRASDWNSGMAASLRAGLRAVAALPATSPAAEGVVITLVDLPDLRVEAVERVMARARGGENTAAVLLRAAYDGRPGHPVFIGAEHWPALMAGLQGDSGANAYLNEHDAELVDCGDLGSGEDRDFAP